MSEKIVQIVEEVKALTVLELAELVKAIEEEFGVSAAAVAPTNMYLPAARSGVSVTISNLAPDACSIKYCSSPAANCSFSSAASDNTI